MVAPRGLERYAPSHLRDWDPDDDGWRSVDGTLCLVDISGFTALSEKLAALGRIGAEELTEVLGRVFGEMLEIASNRGGTLLKFGGDALLLLFESEEHAIQAASAAVEMRTALRKSKDIPTSVGRLALRMSQGIHSGEVLLIHAVGSHRELIVAGPTASWVAHMESIAGANEIVVSAATESLLPPSSVSADRGDGRLLRWRTPKIEPIDVVDLPLELSDDEHSHVPIALRNHLASGAPDSEHRQATVGFIEIAGIDDLISKGGAESAADSAQALVTSIMEIVDDEAITFLGTDMDTNMFKVILVSGVPATIEDEEGRLLRVARRIADLDTPLTVSIGVNRGHVFSGEIGIEARATYTIMGDTVNLAARLMAAAPDGAVYATPAVVDRSLSLFETSDVEPLRVKGKAEPVRALSIGNESGSHTLNTDEDGIFVGRVEELKTLREAVAAVHEGKGGAFTISGPTGIGKTRLLTEALRDGAGTVIEVRAEPYGTANPYRPFRDSIRMLLGIDATADESLPDQFSRRIGEIDDDLAARAPLLGDIAHIDVPSTPETEHISGKFRQDRAADVLIDVLGRLTVDSMVLTFEDTHWADAASSMLLDRLVMATAEFPWLIVQTRRDEPGKGSEIIELEPLSRDDVERLIYAETESAPLRPNVVEALVERSGGSPLFAHELLHVIKATGDADSLPTSLEGVVGAQIDRLEPLARRILRYVSVLGRSFRTSVARDLIRTQGVELDSAARSALTGFLDNDGKDRLQFRHAIVRDVAYEGLSFRRRKELHGHAGQLVLDQYAGSEDSVADVLALHFYNADDYEKAWRFCTMAGNRNMERYANVEAATQFERALNAARHLSGLGNDNQREVYLKLGDLREQSGEFTASMEAYRRAGRLTGTDKLLRAAVLVKTARARERAGSYSAAMGDTTRACNLLQGNPSRGAAVLRANALRYAALIRQAQQRPRDALKLAIETSTIAEDAGDEAALAQSWVIMDWSYIMLGQPEKAQFSRRALDVYQRIGDLAQEAAVSTNLGAIAYLAGDWPGALVYYAEGRDASSKAGNTVAAAHGAANIGEVLVNQGNCVRAYQPLLEARRTYRATGFVEGVVFADILLGRMYAIEGDLAESETSLKSAISMAAELGIDGWRFEATTYLAETISRTGRAEEAIELLVETKEQTPHDYVAYYAPLFSRVYGSILTASGYASEGVTALHEGIAIATARADDYERAMGVLTLVGIAPDEVDEATRTAAEQSLADLGVVKILGFALDATQT